MAPAAWATSTTAAMSAWTSASRPDLQRADLDDHVELGRAVGERLPRLDDLGRGGVAAVREADDRADLRRPCRARIAAARRTSAGRTQTDATSYSAASRQPSSTNASSSSGRSSEWSIVLAMSRSVSVVDRERSCALDLMYGRRMSRASRKPRLTSSSVLSKSRSSCSMMHVAVVAGSPQRAEERAPVDVAQARAGAAPASPCPPRTTPRSYRPVAVDQQVLGLEVEDVRPELADEPRDVDHLAGPGATGRS